MPDLTFCCLVVPDGAEHSRVPTHAQIVVTAPDGHLGPLTFSQGVIFSERENLSAAVHSLEDSVRVVLLLFSYLLDEEAVIVIAGGNWRSGPRRS